MPMDMGTCLRRLCIAALALAAWPAAAQARVVAVAGGSGATFVDVSSRKPLCTVSVGGGRDRRRRRTRRLAHLRGGHVVHRLRPDDSGRPRKRRAPLRLHPRGVHRRGSRSTPRTGRRHRDRHDQARPGARPDDRPARTPQAVAVSSDGTRAVVTQTKGRAVILDLVNFRAVRRLKVTRSTGVAFAPRSGPPGWSQPARRRRRPASSRSTPPACVSPAPSRSARPRRRHRLLARRLARDRRPADANQRTTPRRLPSAAAAPWSRARAPAGASAIRRGRRTARASTWPNRGSDTLSVLSGFRYGRLSTVRLGFPGRGVAVQPGLATLMGTEGPDRLTGTRAPTASRASPATTCSSAAATTTCCWAMPATTSSPAARPTTCSTAARATTASPARPATTSCSAAWATT